jgi:hypothetical protein
MERDIGGHISDLTGENRKSPLALTKPSLGMEVVIISKVKGVKSVCSVDQLGAPKSVERMDMRQIASE